MRKNTAWNVRLGLVERTQRIFGIVALSTFASLAAWASPAIEQRCEELGVGGACACSETFDSATFSTSVGSGNANSDASPAATECYNSSGNWYPASALSIVNETGMPSGNIVSKVWRSNLACGAHVVSGDSRMKSDTKRVCIRSYQKLSADYYDGNTSGGKWIEMTWDGNHSMQYGHNGWGQNNYFSCRIIWDQPIFNCAQSGPLTAPECLGEWCRVEMCIEGDFVNEKGEFYLEGYWERVRDGKRRDVPRQLMGTAKSDIPEDTAFMWPVDGFRGCEGPGIACAPSESSCRFSGNREISHVMQAEWPYQSPGLFIGSAYEVEGGVPGSTPPPPISEIPPTEPPVEPPPPTPDPIPVGSLALTGSAVSDPGGARVSLAVSGGTGPYQFLVDCNRDGNWDGVVNTSQPAAQYVCPPSGQIPQEISGWGWDQATNNVGQVTISYTATTGSTPLGKPGKPSYVSP